MAHPCAEKRALGSWGWRRRLSAAAAAQPASSSPPHGDAAAAAPTRHLRGDPPASGDGGRSWCAGPQHASAALLPGALSAQPGPWWGHAGCRAPTAHRSDSQCEALLAGKHRLSSGEPCQGAPWCPGDINGRELGAQVRAPSRTFSTPTGKQEGPPPPPPHTHTHIHSGPVPVSGQAAVTRQQKPAREDAVVARQPHPRPHLPPS